MAEIKVIEDAASDLAEFIVVGAVRADDIIAIAEKHPAFMMRKHLVDMTEASLHLLDSSGLTQIAHVFRELEQDRSSGRTAVVVPSNVDAVIPKLFSIISEKYAGREETFKITSSRDEALSWLSDDDA